MIIFLLIKYCFTLTSYTELKDNCLIKINNSIIDPFEFFEINYKNFDEIKKRYRTLALCCHPDRLNSLKITDKKQFYKEILSDNMVIINNHFENIKTQIKEETPKEEKEKKNQPQKRKYKDFPLKERFLFKSKRLGYTIIGLLILWFYITKRRFRFFFTYLIIFCLIIISIYVIGIFKTFCLFFLILLYIIGFIPCLVIFLPISIYKFGFITTIIFCVIIVIFKLFCCCCCRRKEKKKKDK